MFIENKIEEERLVLSIIDKWLTGSRYFPSVNDLNAMFDRLDFDINPVIQRLISKGHILHDPRLFVAKRQLHRDQGVTTLNNVVNQESLRQEIGRFRPTKSGYVFLTDR